MSKLPVISWKRTSKCIEKAGFIVVRQKGSHVSLQKITDEGTYRTIVPLHTRLAKGTLLDILHQTGLSKEELIDLL